MRRFFDYFVAQLPLDQVVREISELFPKEAVTSLFTKDIDHLLSVTHDPNGRESLERLKQIDVVAYVDRSLRRAGFRDHDLDEMVQQIIVKLLMGSFFKKWDRASPIDARFKVAVTNAIRTLATKQQTARRRGGELPTDVVATSSGSVVGRDLLERFREYVGKNLGDAVLRLLDHRLEGGDTRDLIGSLGLETSYRTKLVVGHIKEAARRFFSNDPELLSMIERAFQAESQTMQKRFGRGLARQT